MMPATGITPGRAATRADCLRLAPSARSLRASGAVLLRSWAIARPVRTSAATAVIAPKTVSAMTSGSMAC